MASEREITTKLSELFLLTVVVTVTILFIRLLSPFLITILIATIFSRLFYPLFLRITRALGDRRRWAAALTLGVIVLLVVIPISILGILAYTELIAIAARYSAITREVSSAIARFSEAGLGGLLELFPVFEPYMDHIEQFSLQEILRDVMQVGSEFLLQAFQSSFVGAARTVGAGLLGLLLMFFFLLDGEKLVTSISAVIPMEQRDIDYISSETVQVTSATLVSTVLIGFFEGVYGAFLFLLIGIPSPFLWGLIMMVLSVIPLVGTNFVFVPTILILALSGRWVAAFVLLVFGVGGVGISQNLIKPKLLGTRSGLHPAVVLLATLGGIGWLGIIGFLVGPILAGLFAVLWRMLAERYRVR